MKKEGRGKFLAVVAIALLLCCMGITIWTIGAAKKDSDELLQLKNSNAQLQASSDAQQAYIAGQNDMMTELNEQIRTLLSTDEEESEDVKTDSFQDEYPDLYVKDTREQEGKTVYLTFDDGPSAQTSKILDILDEYDAKATFFVVYTDDAEYTQYLQEIVDRGHTLALHSYSHDYDKIYASADAFLADMEKVFDWVYDNTGVRCSLYRFPGGSIKGSKSVVAAITTEMDKRGFTYYDWNVSSGDGSNLTTADNILDNVCPNIKSFDTPVVLMHDATGKTETLEALPKVLETLKEQGYTFEALNNQMTPVQYRKKS